MQSRGTCALLLPLSPLLVLLLGACECQSAKQGLG